MIGDRIFQAQVATPLIREVTLNLLAKLSLRSGGEHVADDPTIDIRISIESDRRAADPRVVGASSAWT